MSFMRVYYGLGLEQNTISFINFDVGMYYFINTINEFNFKIKDTLTRDFIEDTLDLIEASKGIPQLLDERWFVNSIDVYRNNLRYLLNISHQKEYPYQLIGVNLYENYVG